MNHLIQVILLSMMPISELRGAIPLGVLVYHMNPFLVVIVSIISNMIPAIAIIMLFDALLPWVKERFPSIGRFVERFSQTRKAKNRKRIERYGLLAIIAFVAVPLPLTGAWTGSLLTVLFEMPKFKSILAVAVGVVIAGTIVTSSILIGTGKL